MTQLFLIFIGGGLGSLVRFFIGKAIQESIEKTFPFGTLGVNILASLVLGFFLGMIETKNLNNLNNRALIAIGFCGGFSTFSTFANDTLQLLQNNRLLDAFLNVMLNVVLCVSFTFLGLWLVKIVF